jgi:hypothetical protein
MMAEQRMSNEPVIHETATEARAGTGPGIMRLVLLGSLILVVVAFAVIVALGWM